MTRTVHSCIHLYVCSLSLACLLFLNESFFFRKCCCCWFCCFLQLPPPTRASSLMTSKVTPQDNIRWLLLFLSLFLLLLLLVQEPFGILIPPSIVVVAIRVSHPTHSMQQTPAALKGFGCGKASHQRLDTKGEKKKTLTVRALNLLTENWRMGRKKDSLY